MEVDGGGGGWGLELKGRRGVREKDERRFITGGGEKKKEQNNSDNNYKKKKKKKKKKVTERIFEKMAKE